MIKTYLQLAAPFLLEQANIKKHWEEKIDNIIELYKQTKNMPRKQIGRAHV